MKIDDVQIIPIYPKIPARNVGQEARFRDINKRAIFKVTTDNGIVGYGDARCTAPPGSSVEGLLGRNPFD
ncbi:MAG: hypothetical protein QGI83_08485, partial [Candidatus Latescibacteria bacterium]|nr:hypothetical protein [Candidatus Latescibacterota bacterium]